LRKSAVSFFKIRKEVDAGNLFLQKHFKIPEGANSTHLYNVISEHLSEGFIDIYNQIQRSTLSEKKQDMSRRTVRRKRVFEDGKIDFNNSATEIDKLIRATTEPYPGAFSFYKGERCSIWKSELSNVISSKEQIGELLEIKNDRILVQCFESTLWIYDITDSSGNTTSSNIFEIGEQFDLNLSHK